MSRFAILGFFLFLQPAVGAITTTELWQWYEENKESFREPLPIQMHKVMKDTLMNCTFVRITGGIPVLCAEIECLDPEAACQATSCTVATCWPLYENVPACLTAAHVDKNQTGIIWVNVSGQILGGEVVDRDDRDDWLIFKLPHAGMLYENDIGLMRGFDTVPVVGFVEPAEGTAVWKLGYQTGISMGRIVKVFGNGTFEIDGMLAKNGDSGSSICTADDFTNCNLVGIVVRSDSNTLYVEALEVQHIAKRYKRSIPLQKLRNVREMKEELQKLELQYARLENENFNLKHENSNLKHEIESSRPYESRGRVGKPEAKVKPQHGLKKTVGDGEHCDGEHCDAR